MSTNITEMEAALRRFEKETPHSAAECALADALTCVLLELKYLRQHLVGASGGVRADPGS